MVFDTSILDRVKKRLQGEKSDIPEDAAGDTQVIPDFATSILFSTQDMSEKEPTKSVADDVPRAIRLPQLALYEADFYSPTQVIGSDSPSKEMDFGSTQVIPRPNEPSEPSLFVSDTQELPNSNDHAKSDQTQSLAAELTHASLTDEENDLNDAADTSLDTSAQRSYTTKAELRQIEQDLSEQKRLRNIQPEFKKKTINPMQQLLDAFDSDSDEQPAINSEENIHSSPTTSPLAKKADGAEDPSFDFDLEADNIMDLFGNENKKTAQKKKLSPIEEYAERLRKQLNSSPTGSKNEEIDLDESDEDTDFENSEKSQIPKLTKEQAFVLKQKFSKKHLKGNSANTSRFHKQAKLKQSNDLFNELRRANARQITELKQNNPDSELIEEIEKEEEEMGNLLEREMERVRRIRKREKLHEKAQKALLAEGSDDDYDDANQDVARADDSEVPESDVDSAAYDSNGGSESEAESDGEIAINQDKRVARSRRAVVSDEDEDEEGNVSHNHSLAPEIAKRGEENRTDDSYMFGGPSKEVGSDESDEPIMHIYSDMARPESPVSGAMQQNIDKLRDDSHVLFSNLPPPNTTQESSILEAPEASIYEPGSFVESNPTQKSFDGSLLETQVDGPSINGASTQDDRVIPTQMDMFSDDEDGDVRSALDNGRKQIRENFSQVTPDKSLVADGIDDDDNDTDGDNAENEEELKQKLALYEARIRKKELRARKLRKDMERRGMKGIVEGEAEESDDEWKGIGGMDKEESDQADSEDERMIDNTFNLDLNDEEVRKKFMEQYQIKDRRELEKLMDDIKNHRLTKRSRPNGFDIELSDEEDEILMAYRRQKLEEQKQRLLENQKLMQSTKSEKSKAFFECIQEEPSAPILVESESSDASSDEDKKDLPIVISDAETKPKKKKVLEESFVQRQLSFLSKTDEDDYMAIQRVSDAQHGVDDDMDGMEDMALLKKRCLSSLYSRPGSAENIADEVLVEVATDEDEEDFSRVFKRPSMVSSFRSFREKNAAQISTTSFSGVTVNKQYKNASASKASITYMSRQSKPKQEPTLAFKSSKVIEIEARVDKVKLESGASRGRDRFS